MNTAAVKKQYFVPDTIEYKECSDKVYNADATSDMFSNQTWKLPYIL